MTTTTLTMNDDALAEAAGDAALIAVLRGKPADDQVPTAVWWLVAEALRTSVALRRSLAIAPRPDSQDEEMLLAEAALLTDAALAELAEATGARPVPILVEPQLARSVGARAAAAGALQREVLRLARLLVTQRRTRASRLADDLADLHRALHVTQTR